MYADAEQAKLEQAKLAAKVMNVATPGSSMAAGSAGELRASNTQTELKAMQKGLGKCRVWQRVGCVSWTAGVGIDRRGVWRIVIILCTGMVC